MVKMKSLLVVLTLAFDAPGERFQCTTPESQGAASVP